MTSISDAVRDALEVVLAKKELEYENERLRVEALLAECGSTHVAPYPEYWHKLDSLRRQVNLLRRATESPQ